MPLSFGLKVVWFVLSLSGLLSSYIVLPVFPRLFILSPWVPLLYGTIITVLQVMFCIGLAWKMDPFRMPQAFCIAQTTLTHVAWSCLAALAAALTLSTAALVFNYHPLAGILRSTANNPFRIALGVGFPAAVLVLHLTFSLKLNAVQPADSLNCDASQPAWVRLLGYAGTSLLLVIPSFILSCLTALRLIRLETGRLKNPTPQHTVYTHNTLTALPTRQRRLDSKSSPRLNPLEGLDGGETAAKLTPSPIRIPKALLPDLQGRAPSVAQHSKYHLPFDVHGVRAPSPSSRAHSVQSEASTGRGESPVRQIQAVTRSRHGSYQEPPSPIIFNSPSRAESHHHIIVNVSATEQAIDEKDDASLHTRAYEIDLASEDGVSGSLRWARDSDRGSIGKDPYGYAVTEEGEEPGTYAFPPYPRIRRSLSGQPPWLDEPPDPDPRLSCIVMFQLLACLIQMVAPITSLIDILTPHSPPTRLGTQHVALLLAAWMPTLLAAMSLCRRYFARGPP